MCRVWCVSLCCACGCGVVHAVFCVTMATAAACKYPMTSTSVTVCCRVLLQFTCDLQEPGRGLFRERSGTCPQDYGLGSSLEFDLKCHHLGLGGLTSAVCTEATFGGLSDVSAPCSPGSLGQIQSAFLTTLPNVLLLV